MLSRLLQAYHVGVQFRSSTSYEQVFFVDRNPKRDPVSISARIHEMAIIE